MSQRWSGQAWRGHSGSSSSIMSIFTSLNYPWPLRWVQTPKGLASALQHPWATSYAYEASSLLSTIECYSFAILDQTALTSPNKSPGRLYVRLRPGSWFITQCTFSYIMSLQLQFKLSIKPSHSLQTVVHILVVQHPDTTFFPLTQSWKCPWHNTMQNNIYNWKFTHHLPLQRKITRRMVRFGESAPRSGCLCDIYSPSPNALLPWTFSMYGLMLI